MTVSLLLERASPFAGSFIGPYVKSWFSPIRNTDKSKIQPMLFLLAKNTFFSTLKQPLGSILWWQLHDCNASGADEGNMTAIGIEVDGTHGEQRRIRAQQCLQASTKTYKFKWLDGDYD